MSSKISSSSRLTLETPIVITVELINSHVFAGEDLECLIKIAFDHDDDGDSGSGPVKSSQASWKECQPDSDLVQATQNPESHSSDRVPRSAIQETRRLNLIGRSNSPTLLERQRKGLGWPADSHDEHIHPTNGASRQSQGTVAADDHGRAESQSKHNNSRECLSAHSPTPSQASHKIASFLSAYDNASKEEVLQTLVETNGNIQPTPGDQNGVVSISSGFAQFSGFFAIDESMMRSADFQSLKDRPMYAAMGCESRAEADNVSTAASSDDALNGIWRLGTSLLGFGAEHKSASAHRAAGGGGGSILPSRSHLTSKVTDHRYPIISAPPSILFSDLTIRRGHQHIFHYALPIPSDLPPSHQGGLMKINYSFAVGIQVEPYTGSKTSQKRGDMLNIPVRIANNVSFGGIRLSYDLLSPILLYHDAARVSEEDEFHDGLRVTENFDGELFQGKEDLRQELRSYLQNLMQSGPKHARKVSTGLHRPTHRRQDTLSVDAADEEEKGSSLAIELATSSSLKASYDLALHGQIIAKMSLPRTNYKIGEVITGFLSLNAFELPVYQISISLTSHEIVQSSFLADPTNLDQRKSLRQVASLGTNFGTSSEYTPPHNPLESDNVKNDTYSNSVSSAMGYTFDMAAHDTLRRTYSQHHESTIGLRETGFTLAIPSDASPDFTTTGLRQAWFIRLEFLTGRPQIRPQTSAEKPESGPGFSQAKSMLSMEMKSQDSRHQMWRALHELEVEMFECNIPLRVYPSTDNLGRKIVRSKVSVA